MITAPASVSFGALGSIAVLCVTAEDALERARGALENELYAIDLACSRFRPDSELVRLNDRAGGPVQVSERLFEAVEVAVRAAETTGGLVDPTVGRALSLSGYDRTFPLVGARDGATFRPEFELVPGWREIHLDPRERTVRFPRGVELDLGATAKALAADRAARAAAAEAAGAGVLVSLGGDIAVAGAPPETGWPVRVSAWARSPWTSPPPWS